MCFGIFIHQTQLRHENAPINWSTFVTYQLLIRDVLSMFNCLGLWKIGCLNVKLNSIYLLSKDIKLLEKIL